VAGIKPDEVKNRLKGAFQKYGVDMLENTKQRNELCIPIMQELMATYDFDEAATIYNDAVVEVLQELGVIPPQTKKELN
jgi:hypothetical protein